jgi:hypothetical protein
MKRRLFLLVILVSVTCACSGSAGSPAPPSGSSSATPFIYPSDEELQNILPAEVGTSWVYAIEVGSVDPVRYQDITFPTADGQVSDANIEFLPGLAGSDSHGKVFTLALRIVAAPSQQGPFAWRHAVELTPTRDDLGIYAGASHVFWLMSGGSSADKYVGTRTEVSAVETYPKESEPNGRAVSEGVSIRFIQAGCYPGTCKKNYSADDTLTSLWPTKEFPSYEGTWVYPYEREVAPHLGSDPSFACGFVEDTWYAAKIGLVRLEQRVCGSVSMIWTLQSYQVPNP